MKFSDFDSNLNNLLMPWRFDDFCPNGCLVEPFLGDNHQVKKVVTGVANCKQKFSSFFIKII